MKCPNCEYEHDKYGILGEYGGFYETRIQLERECGDGYYTSREIRDILACPKCKIMFID